MGTRDEFCFLHAADVHLDSPLVGLARYPGAPHETIRVATREAFANLVDLALAEAVDFLLIAGDLYDGDWKDYRTGLYFNAQMSRLEEVGIPVLVIAGNHDAASQITRRLRPPGNVHLFDTAAPGTRILEALEVAVHGQGFPRREVTEDLSRGYPPPLPGHFNIGLLHTALDGREGHAPYAPASVQGLRARGYDYWALGHVHRREVVSEEPWIVYPGNLQGRHVRETGPKGASLVRVQGRRALPPEHRELDVVRWFATEVECSGARDIGEVLAAVEAALARVAEEAGSRLAAVRVRLVGATAADAALRAGHEGLVGECRSLALGFSDLWLEQVRVETRPGVDNEAALARDDAFGQLLRGIRDLEADPSALAALGEQFDALARRLPPEVLNAQPDPFDPRVAETLRPALADVKAILIERLTDPDAAR